MSGVVVATVFDVYYGFLFREDIGSQSIKIFWNDAQRSIIWKSAGGLWALRKEWSRLWFHYLDT